MFRLTSPDPGVFVERGPVPQQTRRDRATVAWLRLFLLQHVRNALEQLQLLTVELYAERLRTTDHVRPFRYQQYLRAS